MEHNVISLLKAFQQYPHPVRTKYKILMDYSTRPFIAWLSTVVYGCPPSLFHIQRDWSPGSTSDTPTTPQPQGPSLLLLLPVQRSKVPAHHLQSNTSSSPALRLFYFIALTITRHTCILQESLDKIGSSSPDNICIQWEN